MDKNMKEIKVSDRERRVLKVLADGYDSGWYGEGSQCYFFRYIAKELKLEITQVRRACRALARKGLAEYVRGLFDDDGMVAGSGYCATKEGALLINACKDCKKELSAMVTGQCSTCWDKKESK
jgi:DNA-binding transcriptional MocR family regulator